MSNNLPIRIQSKARNHTELDVSVRGHSLKVDEPESFGGNDKGPNPIEYLFAGLAGCLNVTLHQIAEEKDVEVELLKIDVMGNLDTEGFSDSESDKRAGFEEIDVQVEMESSADKETEEEILEEAENRCPVSDNLSHETNLNIERK